MRRYLKDCGLLLVVGLGLPALAGYLLANVWSHSSEVAAAHVAGTGTGSEPAAVSQTAGAVPDGDVSLAEAQAVDLEAPVLVAARGVAVDQPGALARDEESTDGAASADVVEGQSIPFVAEPGKAQGAVHETQAERSWELSVKPLIQYASAGDVVQTPSSSGGGGAGADAGFGSSGGGNGGSSGTSASVGSDGTSSLSVMSEVRVPDIGDREVGDGGPVGSGALGGDVFSDDSDASGGEVSAGGSSTSGGDSTGDDSTTSDDGDDAGIDTDAGGGAGQDLEGVDGNTHDTDRRREKDEELDGEGEVEQEDRRTLEYRKSRFITHLLIGGSAESQALRMIGWDLNNIGWEVFRQRWVDPHLRAGVTRVMLHNPFGQLRGEPMQFDQFLDAQQAELNVVNGFVEAWKPIVDTGVEVIAYMGSPRHDADSKTLEASGIWEDYWEYAQACLKPCLDAGMSIGFDAASEAGADTFTYRLAEELRSLGVKVYIESRPPAAHVHWHGYPVVSEQKYWERSNPEIYRDSGRLAKNEDLTGEVILLYLDPAKGESWEESRGWMPEEFNRRFDEGRTVCVNYLHWNRYGFGGLEELLVPVSSALFD